MLILAVTLLAAVIALCCVLGTILRSYDRHPNNSISVTDSLCNWDYFTTDLPE